ncbi:hypothetical protein D3C81_1805470 [compost metagenome]
MQILQDFRVQVGPARQLFLVQRLEHLGLDQRWREGGVQHDQVITGMAGEQFGLHRFVGIEGVVDDFDAGGLFEVGHGFFTDVIRPVVQPQRMAVVHLSGVGIQCQRYNKQTGNHLKQRLAHSKCTL